MGSSAGIMMASSTAAQGLSSLGTAYSQSTAMQSQGAYQKMIAQSNAGMANIESQDALQRGATASAQAGLQARQVIGSQRAGMAGQGVDVNSGSAVDVQASTAAMGALDQLNITNNAWRQSFGYQVQATNESYGGQFAQMGADNAAGNTMLTGGMNFLSAGIRSGAYASGAGGGGYFNPLAGGF